MVKFKIKNKLFREFLETVRMDGILQFQGNKKIKSALFPSFILKAKQKAEPSEDFEELDEEEKEKEAKKLIYKQRLTVECVDVLRKKTNGKFFLLDVDVLEEGEIPITDYELIKKVLSRTALKGEILVEYDDILEISKPNGDHKYTVRQTQHESFKIYTSDQDELVKARTTLQYWSEWCKFDGEDGLLVMHHPKAGDITYKTRIEIPKSELENITGDAIKITNDNKTRLVMKDGEFWGYKGKGNANVQSEHKIGFDDTGKELIEFDKNFFSLQTIIPNLFKKVEFSIRKATTKDQVNIWIRSTTKDKKIIANIALASVIEDED